MIKRITRLVISLGLYCWDLAGDSVQRILGRPLSPRGVVLYYHAVKAHQRTHFARQMDELVKRAHRVAADFQKGLTRHAWNVAVTFDDGFVSVIANALPELQKREIPFTIFVPSGCLGQRPSWIYDPSHPSWREQVLSRKDLRGLARVSLAQVGSHSVSHSNFLRLSPERVTEELTSSKAELESELGREVSLFSFPHGAHNDHLDQLARQAGYRKVFTIEPSTVGPENTFVFGRFLADPDDWLLEFRLKIAGAYRWQHHVQRFRRRH